MARLARLPIRIRLTLAFAGVMAVVLAATGLFLYLRLGSELDATIAAGLRSRAGDVSALIQQADSGLSEARRGTLTGQGESLAQIIAPGGSVVDSTPGLGRGALLDGLERSRALHGPLFVDRPTPRRVEDGVRLLAVPVRAQGRRLLVVVGTPLEDRHDALRNLAGLLAIGGPVALLLASLAGYGVAAAALQPVERMRRRAAAIQATERGARLPVPPSRDELGRLGETLNEMLARLEAAFARERTFVSDAAHELRTPLAILKAELELALRGGQGVEELEAALRSASEETDRLVALAEDLLVVARADQGRLPVRLEPLAVSSLFERVRERQGRRVEARGGELHVDPADGEVIQADPMRLEQALGNLLDNASRHGGRRLELALTTEDGNVELHVRDDGPGFPPGFLDSAFERFSRADSARGRGGAGLGLAIVAAIAEAHGGFARARNRPEGGADVWLALPAAG